MLDADRHSEGILVVLDGNLGDLENEGAEADDGEQRLDDANTPPSSSRPPCHLHSLLDINEVLTGKLTHFKILILDF